MPRSPVPPDQPDREGERIAKLLARAGVASRREVERMIAEGRIARDGETIGTPATLLRSLAGVTVDGTPVAAPAPARLFLYHKPPGLLVTERDPGGRPTIYDRLPSGLPRVVPVGRLDLATEGLLLLTTDGGLKRTLELPATGVERTYRARAYGPVTQTQLEELIEGVEVDGIRYGSIDANLERRTGANVWIELTLTEGKNREVRRVLEHLGLQVGRLIRTRYGPFVLGDLQPGEVGEVRQHDLVAFRQTLRGKVAGSTLPDRVTVAPMVVERASMPAASEPTRSPGRSGNGARSRRAPSAAIGATAGAVRGGVAPRAGRPDDAVPSLDERRSRRGGGESAGGAARSASDRRSPTAAADKGGAAVRPARVPRSDRASSEGGDGRRAQGRSSGVRGRDAPTSTRAQRPPRRAGSGGDRPQPEGEDRSEGSGERPRRGAARSSDAGRPSRRETSGGRPARDRGDRSSSTDGSPRGGSDRPPGTGRPSRRGPPRGRR